MARRMVALVDGGEKIMGTIAEMCRHFEIKRRTVEERMRRGWHIHDALRLPVDAVDSANARKRWAKREASR